MPSSLLKACGPFHFVGIGGIGMSGLAEALHSMNIEVQGSDCQSSINTKRLESKGIKVFIGHEPENIVGAKFVVLSTAIAQDNPEVLAAKQSGIELLHRSEILRALADGCDCLAISGTHGKTTTTSLFGYALVKAGLDPTIVNGGIMNAWDTNVRPGKGSWLVAEADESDGTFNLLHPSVAVVTNIDPEHLDYYGSFDRLKKAYKSFLDAVPFWGNRILCIDCPNTRKIYESYCTKTTQGEASLITYGFADDADIQIYDINAVEMGSTFRVRVKNLAFASEFDGKKYKVALPGRHNVLNSASVIAFAASSGKLTYEQLVSSLSEFDGVQRRYTKIGTYNGCTLVDDYAHHPREIGCVIEAARSQSRGKVHVIFQPHRFSRLDALWSEFVEILCTPDSLTLMPVYAAGESEIDGIDSSYLANEIKSRSDSLKELSLKDIALLNDKDEMIERVQDIVADGDTLIFMGAGSISLWGRKVAEELTQANIAGEKKLAC